MNALATIALAFVVSVIIALVLVKAVEVLSDRLHIDEHVIEGSTKVSTFVLTAYSFILAFILAASLANYNFASESSAREATALTTFAHSVVGLPPDVRDVEQHQGICYARAVIQYEWPAMARHETSQQTSAALNGLFEPLIELKTRPGGSTTDITDVETDLRSIVSERTNRIKASNYKLPSLLWIFIFVGAVINILIMALLLSRTNFWTRILLLTTLVFVVTLVISIVSALERPFGNSPIRVEPVAMESFLATRAEFLRDPSADRPCP